MLKHILEGIGIYLAVLVFFLRWFQVAAYRDDENFDVDIENKR